MVKKSLFSWPTHPNFKNPEWWTSTAVHLATFNAGGVAVDLAKILKTEPTPEEELHSQLAELYREAFKVSVTGSQAMIVREVLDQTDLDLEPREALAAINPDFPTHHPYYERLLSSAVEKLIFENAYSDLYEPRFRRTFCGCFHDLRRGSGPLVEIDGFIDRLGNSRESVEGQAWNHLNQVLNALAQDRLPILEDITLPQIYITPRALHKHKRLSRGLERRSRSAEDETQKIPNLIAALLENLEESAVPILVHGQPGHGKTSSMRMLCHALSTQQRFTEGSEQTLILFYEFKNLTQLDNNEIRVLSDRTPFVEDEHFFHGRRTLLILDGMDERQITDGTDHAFQGFIRRLFQLTDQLNRRDDGTWVQLILTGRTQFVQQVQGSFGSEYHLFEIQDFDEGQIERWLARFSGLRELAEPLTFEQLVDSHLEELAQQPILLTISAPMLVDPRGRELLRESESGPLNRGLIYRTILRWTYEKRWHAQPARALDLPDFVEYQRLLRAIAFTIFRSGGGSIKISRLQEELQKHKERYLLQDCQSLADGKIERTLESVAVSFFFEGWSEKSFEFIHKSILDYLTVDALLSYLAEVTEDFNPKKAGKSCNRIASDLYFLLGKSTLSPEDHAPFLEDLVHLDSKRSTELFEPLLQFFRTAQDHAYLIQHEQGQNENPLVTEANVMATLVRIVVVVFNSWSDDKRRSRVNSGYLQLFKIRKQQPYLFITLLEGTIGSTNLDLRRLNLSYSNLVRKSLAKARFDHANLQFARLHHARLSEASLAHADLKATYLANSDLTSVNFSSADLRNVNGLSPRQIRYPKFDESTKFPENEAFRKLISKLRVLELMKTHGRRK